MTEHIAGSTFPRFIDNYRSVFENGLDIDNLGSFIGILNQAKGVKTNTKDTLESTQNKDTGKSGKKLIRGSKNLISFCSRVLEFIAIKSGTKC